jgi:uncharacterized repeat protein (TIGR01451 family)
LSGSKPNLTSNGEGITSIKINDLFGVGVTKVSPLDPQVKIELPVGYTLFNNLAYSIETEAVFSGPNDFSFMISSATTRTIFDKLRILYADYDRAEPKKPRWIDATIVPEWWEYWQRYLPKAAFDSRLPNFKTRTLHALMEENPRILVVALKDSSQARDSFVADVEIKTTAPLSVMEGREITYSFKITNHGPDTATDISFKSYVAMGYVSLAQTQGLCRWEAHIIYCNIGQLAKGASATITFRAKCRWDFYFDDKPSGSDPDATPQISAAEQDPNYENNYSFVSTSVEKDPNKAPAAEITTPKMNELIPGPDAIVNIVAKVTDPDGFVTDVEFFDWDQPIGKGELRSEDEYQFVYKKVRLGRHWLKVRVTDNLGRQKESGPYDFFVNGEASVKITSPKDGAAVTRQDGYIPVVVEASHGSRKITKVELHPTGGGETQALPDGENRYAAKLSLATCQRHCQLQAVVIDESGIETRSIPVNFKITEPPVVTLYQYDGEYTRKITDSEPFDSRVSLKLVAGAEYEQFGQDSKIVKLEFYVDGKLFDVWQRDNTNSEAHSHFQTELNKLAPGSYEVFAVVTDSDGSMGKSATVRISIKPR